MDVGGVKNSGVYHLEDLRCTAAQVPWPDTALFAESRLSKKHGQSLNVRSVKYVPSNYCWRARF